MIWFLWVICSAVAYTVGRFIVLDNMFEGTRNKVNNALTTLREIGEEPRILIKSQDPKGWAKLPLGKRKLHDLINCPHCIAAYPAAVAVAVADRYYSVPLPVFMWFAVWTGGLVFWRIVDSE